MKKISPILSFLLLITGFSAQAQNEPTPSEVKIESCSERLRDKKNDNLWYAERIGGGGLIGAAATGAGVMAGVAIAVPITIIGVAAAASTTLLISAANKNVALKLLEGSGEGGNKQTLKAWNRANKKNPELFSKITYAEFLASIHKADVNGNACRLKSKPSKNDVINIVKLDLEDESKDGESNSEKNVDQSPRGANSKSNLPTKDSPKKESPSSSAKLE